MSENSSDYTEPALFANAKHTTALNKKEYGQQVDALRQRLLKAQVALREADFPVIILFGGVDGAGKVTSLNLLNQWMDARGIVTRAFDEPTQDERERPDYWRFWRALPRAGEIGVFLSAWYHNPLLSRAYKNASVESFDAQLQRISTFEQTLANDGALILKFWMHLDRDAQKQRLEEPDADPSSHWRVTEIDWKHWRMYADFTAAAEHLIRQTSKDHAPWIIVDGSMLRNRSIEVATRIAQAMEGRLASDHVPTPPDRGSSTNTDHLAGLDSGKSLARAEYRARRKLLYARLNGLHNRARQRGIATVLAFEGWDASGKGGAIRRITSALDARYYRVIRIAAPTDEERAHHYLWRFWRHVPRAGRVSIFDRSWYGRVLVERVEGFAKPDEWQRAYAEIEDFEDQLAEHGTVLVKLFIHVTKDEQARRFEERERIPHKRWKLTSEDWRNREQWDDYEVAANEMIERTSTSVAPWTIVEGNDKYYARIKVLETVCEALERALGST